MIKIYIVRIELHNQQGEIYDRLRDNMIARGFSHIVLDTITNTGWHQLPPAEYQKQGEELQIDTVLGFATPIVVDTLIQYGCIGNPQELRDYAIVVTGDNGMRWKGLPSVPDPNR